MFVVVLKCVNRAPAVLPALVTIWTESISSFSTSFVALTPNFSLWHRGCETRNRRGNCAKSQYHFQVVFPVHKILYFLLYIILFRVKRVYFAINKVIKPNLMFVDMVVSFIRETISHKSAVFMKWKKHTVTLLSRNILSLFLIISFNVF